jgi:hypothetical protein
MSARPTVRALCWKTSFPVHESTGTYHQRVTWLCSWFRERTMSRGHFGLLCRHNCRFSASKLEHRTAHKCQTAYIKSKNMYDGPGLIECARRNWGAAPKISVLSVAHQFAPIRTLDPTVKKKCIQKIFWRADIHFSSLKWQERQQAATKPRRLKRERPSPFLKVS